MAGQGEAKTSARRIAVAKKEVAALELRAEGATFEEIAVELGYADRSGPYRAVTRALKETKQESADELRKLEGMRLDRMQKAIWPAATGDHGASRAAPDLQAIGRALQIMKRRAMLFGLDAPTKTEVTGAEGGPIDLEVAREVLATRLSRVAERRRSKKARSRSK